MRPLLYSIGLSLLLVPLVGGGVPLTPLESSAASQVGPDTTKPLRPLMVGLAQDMDRIAMGLWYEDYDFIEQGARSIANHPRISPNELAAIKKALGEEFQGFVASDKSVHHTATKLVDAAQARDWSAVLDAYRQLQQGCLGCHTAYREQLRPVLRSSEPGD